MGSSKPHPCFVLHVAVSLVTHVAELLGNAMLAAALYWTAGHRDVIFPLAVGVLLLPLVATHLLSAVLLLRRRGDSMSCGQATLMALLHVLQLGFIWRHLDLFRGRELVALRKHNDLTELLLLRLTFTFSAGLPLLLLQLYLLMLLPAQLCWPWALHAAVVASTLSCVWAVASFRRCSSQESKVLSWPGFLFRLLWRTGEIASRVISLALFARLYHEWIFLVLAFHWIIMLVCLSVPQTVTEGCPGSSLIHRAAVCVATSYSYVFCYVGFSGARSAVWYTLYYVVMFLENGTLSIVWMTRTSAGSFVSGYLPVCISALAFLAAMVSLVVYFKFFHVTSSPSEKRDMRAAANQLTCCQHHASVCAKHHHRGLEGPLSCAWTGECGLHGGRTCKRTVPDSEQNLPAGDLLSCQLHGKLSTTGESNGHCCIHTSITCPHNQSANSTNSRSELTDSTSALSLGDVNLSLRHDGSKDTQPALPVWLPSGDSFIAEHLLTDDWDQPQEWRLRQEKDLQQCCWLLRQEAQRWQLDADGSVRRQSMVTSGLSVDRSVVDLRAREFCTHCCRVCSHGDSEVSSVLKTVAKEEASIKESLNEECGAWREKPVIAALDFREAGLLDSRTCVGLPVRRPPDRNKLQQHSVFIIADDNDTSLQAAAHEAKQMTTPAASFHEDSSSNNSKTKVKRKIEQQGKISRNFTDVLKTQAFACNLEKPGLKADIIDEKDDVDNTRRHYDSEVHTVTTHRKTLPPGVARYSNCSSHWTNSKFRTSSPASSLQSSSSEHVYENLWNTCAQGKLSTKDKSEVETETPGRDVATAVKRRQQQRAVLKEDSVTLSIGRSGLKEQGKKRSFGGSRSLEEWMGYSESEDSALPPETFSSSNDCFTASEVDSDGSPELVI